MTTIKKYWWMALLAVVGFILFCVGVFVFVVPALAPSASVGIGQKVEVTREVPIYMTVVVRETAVAQATATPAPAATNHVDSSDFPRTAAEVIRIFNLRDEFNKPLAEGYVQPCPNGPDQVEKNCWEVKTSPFFIDNPWSVWLEGFRHYPGTLRPGGFNHPERSGIPPMSNDVLVDSGITIRPAGDYDMAPSPGPMTWDQELDNVEVIGFPHTAKQAAAFYGIDISKTNVLACGENHCYIIRPTQPNEAFMVKNGQCWMDGYRVSGGEVRRGFETEADADKISVPPGFQGFVVEFVVRPCEADQEAMLKATQPETTPAMPTDAPTPMPSPTALPSTNTPAATAMSSFSKEAAAAMYGIDLAKVNASPCAGEKNCWKFTGKGGFFSVKSPLGCWQTGYRAEPGELMSGQADKKTGIPPGFTGLVEVLDARQGCP